MIYKLLQRYWPLIGILILGILVRVWELGTMPPGLNQDEASIGYEAYSLLHFGIDRNGLAYPVHFISWGSGQNALYAYLSLPFIALGLTPLTVRMLMLLSAIASIPLTYYIANQTFGEKCAVLSAFLLAISPWHIMLSRWALESNLLPFFFLLGYASFIKSFSQRRWFIVACVAFALCLYCYGTAYVAIPLFISIGLILAVKSKLIEMNIIIIGLLCFFIVALPILLFIAVNSLRLETMRFLMFSIPRLASVPRYEALSVFFNSGKTQIFQQNLARMVQLLLYQNDDLPWNSMERYGYLYKITFPFAFIGICMMLPLRRSNIRCALLLWWLVIALVIGVVQEANTNRVNLIFIPLIICLAFFIVQADKKLRGTWLVLVMLFLIGLGFFMRDYLSEQRVRLGEYFFDGMLPALTLAQQSRNEAICVTDQVNMPYIYALFSEQTDPNDFVRTVRYVDPQAPFRVAKSFGRYTFGLQNCDVAKTKVYVLSARERPPTLPFIPTIRTFGSFVVYLP